MIAPSKLSQNDLDSTDLERIKLRAGGPGSLVEFSTGRNLWGPKSNCRDSALCCASKQDVANAVHAPTCHDGVLEVVTADDVFSMGATLMTTNGLGGRAKRLVRAKELRITTKADVYMQIDGEPWLQPPATVHLKCFGQSTVLKRSK